MKVSARKKGRKEGKEFPIAKSDIQYILTVRWMGRTHRFSVYRHCPDIMLRDKSEVSYRRYNVWFLAHHLDAHCLVDIKALLVFLSSGLSLAVCSMKGTQHLVLAVCAFLNGGYVGVMAVIVAVLVVSILL
jgi:hypothetical protein